MLCVFFMLYRYFSLFFFFFFFNDTATTEIYTLSLHDALPISHQCPERRDISRGSWRSPSRSEEHTSELQSLRHLVCRLLLEKKKNKDKLVLIEKKKTEIKDKQNEGKKI